MSTRISNTIRFDDRDFTEDQLKKIKGDFTRMDEDEKRLELDFNKFLPQPKPIINVGLTGTTKKSYSAFYKRNPLDLDEKTMYECLNNDKCIIKIDNKSTMMLSREYIDKWYKENNIDINDDELLDDWYEWNIDNWGTKFNAYDTTFQPQYIEFTTSNGEMSDKLLSAMKKKFSEMFTEEEMEHLVYDVQYETYEYARVIRFSEIK